MAAAPQKSDTAKKPAEPPGQAKKPAEAPGQAKKTNTPPTASSATYPLTFIVGTPAWDLKAKDILNLLKAADADKGDKVDIVSVTDRRTPSAITASRCTEYVGLRTESLRPYLLAAQGTSYNETCTWCIFISARGRCICFKSP